MPEFRFKAIDAGGKVVTGVSSAQDSENLSGILHSQGLFLMESQELVVVEAGAPVEAPPKTGLNRSIKLPSFGKKKIKLKELAFVTTQFAIMIRCALPIFESLELLAAQNPNPRLQTILRDISKRVSEGLQVSAAFAQYPDLFDDVYVSLLAAGEMSGHLDQMLERLASHLSFRVKLGQSIRSVLMYPMVVISTTIAVIGFLVVFVLPTFMEIFQQLNVDLPWPTVLLITVSNGIRQWWWAMLLAAVAAGLGFRRWLKSPVNERRFSRALLATPVIGPLMQNIIMTRTLRTLGSLIDSGVPVIKCLELSKTAAGNPIFADLLDKVSVDVREGKALSSSFAESPYIPRVIVGMLSTGERTGTIPEVIMRASAFYEAETESAIKDLFSALEPIFILGLGIMVGGVAVSVLLPMFNLAEGIK